MCVKAKRQCPGYSEDKARAFVNFDANNVLASDKKTVFCRAIAESKQEATIKRQSIPLSQTRSSVVLSHSSHLSVESPPTRSPVQPQDVVPLDKIQLITLHALDFTPGEFRQHFEALWDSFQDKYDRTNTYWPSGCSQLAQRNEALDLALIALSAQRLAFSRGSDQRLTLLSLTAYDRALNLFIKLMQQQRDEFNQSSAMLAVISTIFSLLEGSQSSLDAILEHGWRWSKHLHGALELLKQSGPEAFSAGGFHIVFQKIREMGVCDSRHSKILLNFNADEDSDSWQWPW